MLSDRTVDDQVNNGTAANHPAVRMDQIGTISTSNGDCESLTNGERACPWLLARIIACKAAKPLGDRFH